MDIINPQKDPWDERYIYLLRVLIDPIKIGPFMYEKYTVRPLDPSWVRISKNP